MSDYFHKIRSIRVINPAVAVLTLLTLGNAQTRLALLSLTRKVRVQKEEEHLVDVPQYICPLAYAAIPFVGIAQTYCIIFVLLKG